MVGWPISYVSIFDQLSYAFVVSSQATYLRGLHNIMPVNCKWVLAVVEIPETEQSHINAYMTRRDPFVILDRRIEGNKLIDGRHD
jgi:hypothetical protein